MSAEREALAAVRASLRDKLEGETAKIEWRALQRFFAAGKTVHVAPGLDLVEVATHVAADDRAALERWLRAGDVGPVDDDRAREWYEADAVVWSVVVRPWVLVQAVAE